MIENTLNIPTDGTSGTGNVRIWGYTPPSNTDCAIALRKGVVNPRDVFEQLKVLVEMFVEPLPVTRADQFDLGKIVLMINELFEILTLP